MNKIKILDESTIQQIAAGEVIERPSSIVKELIENSIDAKSRNITVEIKDGGKSYIRITDDGEGMTEEEIGLAFKRHSTSKLNTIEDIYNVLSLGFRGEALASISSVSHVEVLSKTEDSDVGVQVILKNGEIETSNTIGSPKGTTIIVRDIFYNLPVREKFLKSSNIEGNHIGDIVNKLAIGNFNISFKFIKDGNSVIKTPQKGKLSNTIYSILGKEYHNNFIPIDYSDDDFNLSGFISNNNLYRSNRNHQYLYINGRFISHLNISRIIEKIYRSLIPLNRFPVFILNINIDPNKVDVNIHPTKQEVKFVDSEYIYDIISKVIRETLMPSVTVSKMDINSKKTTKEDDIPKLFNYKEENDLEIKDEDKDVDRGSNIVVRDLTGDNISLDQTEEDDFIDTGNNNFQSKWKQDSSRWKMESEDIVMDKEVMEQKIDDILLDIKPIGRVFNTYILAESKYEEKLFFIDQHAAHERVMYEKYKKEYTEEDIVVQQLMYPEVIKLTNREISTVREDIEIFRKLGFDLEDFGDDSIVLRGVPMIFGEPKIRDLFLDILDNLSSNIKNSYETKIDKIMKLSCTNAIKSGDKMEDLEIMALFESLKKCENPYTCPHGRPTIMELTKKDIEKHFLRIV